MTPKERSDRIKALKLELKTLQAGEQPVEVFWVITARDGRDAPFVVLLESVKGKFVTSYSDGIVLAVTASGGTVRGWASATEAFAAEIATATSYVVSAGQSVLNAKQQLKAVKAAAKAYQKGQL